MKLGVDEVIFRAALPSDRAWVCSTWRDSMHEKHPSYTRRQCHAMVNALYLLSPVEVQVAEIAGEPPVLAGFAAHVDGEMVWLYVSKDFRGKGIARMLKA